MKNYQSFWLILLLIGPATLGNSISYIHAFSHQAKHADAQFFDSHKAEQTAIPTAASAEVGETPEIRVLPPVGSNAVLVIGASVLVLIIIGGVLSSRRKQNH
jgi:hypothetical protein